MSYPIYCLFAYKENSVDILRGCVMDRYNSNYVCEKHINRERLFEELEKLFWKNTHLKDGESEYDEIDIFVCTQFNTKEEWVQYPDESYKYILLDRYSDEYKTLIKEATGDIDLKIKKEKERIRLEEEKKKEAQRKSLEMQERREWERLNKKFNK